MTYLEGTRWRLTGVSMRTFDGRAGSRMRSLADGTFDLGVERSDLSIRSRTAGAHVLAGAAGADSGPTPGGTLGQTLRKRKNHWLLCSITPRHRSAKELRLGLNSRIVCANLPP